MSYNFQPLYAKMAEIEAMTEEVANEAQQASRLDHIAAIEFTFFLGQFFDRIAAVKKGYDATYDRLSREIVPEAMRDAGVKTITLESIGRRVTVSHRFSCSIINKEDKDPAYDWLRAENLGDIIVPTVNSQTLSAVAKERVEEQGKDMPPDLFKTGTSPFTSFTSVKK